MDKQIGIQELREQYSQKMVGEFVKSIEAADDAFFQSEERTQKYVSLGNRKRQIRYKFETFTINRRVYRNKETGELYYHVDQLFELLPYKWYQKEVREDIYNSYGNESIQSIAHRLGMSRMAVYDVLYEIGVVERKELVESSIETSVHVQGDEKYFSHQKSTRKKGQIRLMTVFTDKVEVCRNKHRLVNKKTFLFNDRKKPEAIQDEIMQYLQLRYPNLNRIYFSSDAGKWLIQVQEAFPKATFIYDLFHYKQYLMIIFSGHRKLAKKANQFVREDRAYDFIQYCFNFIEEYKPDNGKAIEAVQTIANLWGPIQNNFKLRGYLGSNTEAQISHIATKYFAARPKGFSQRRMNAYLRVVEYKVNGWSYEQIKDAQIKKKSECRFESISERERKPVPGRSSPGNANNIPTMNSSKTGFKQVLKRLTR
ncbi:UPF0236 family transposase-like protein [Culicoidibacter larvae]|nr:UPF0236 family protein [Culicoidibacter larvae]